MERDIEAELTELQLRHKLHQQKMEDQRLRKIQAREDDRVMPVLVQAADFRRLRVPHKPAALVLQELHPIGPVDRITVTRTKGGTRSVAFRATKQLDVRTDYLHTLTTPYVQIDKPADGESGDVQVEKKHVTAIVKALNECERYAEGERSQQLLSFDKDKEALNAQFRDKDQPELAGV